MRTRRARRNPFGSKDLRQMASANPVPIKSGHKKPHPNWVRFFRKASVPLRRQKQFLSLENVTVTRRHQDTVEVIVEATATG